MKKVLFRAPVLTNSGYGVHSRQVIEYLFSLLDQDVEFFLDVEPMNCGPSPYIVDKSRQNGLIGRIYEHTKRNFPNYDVSIQVHLPNEWIPSVAKKNIGITAGVETDFCNPQWIDHINSMDLVIVPSEYTKKCFTNTSERFGKEITTPIAVVREFVDPIYTQDPEKGTDILDSLTTPFNFFVFGQITGNTKENDRKNLWASLYSFYEAFKGNPNVGVIVKANMGRLTELDKFHVNNILEQIKAAIWSYDDVEKQPKLWLLHGDMTEDELRKVYTSPKVKALLTTTRGEAVGLPILEAAACGLPILATDKGGHTEYLKNDKWIKLPSKLQPIANTKIDNNLFMGGSQWYEVDMDKTVQALQKFYKANETPKEWARQMKPYVRETFTRERVLQYYDIVLREFFVGE